MFGFACIQAMLLVVVRQPQEDPGSCSCTLDYPGHHMDRPDLKEPSWKVSVMIFTGLICPLTLFCFERVNFAGLELTQQTAARSRD